MYMQYNTEYDVTNISDTRPGKNMITMEKVDNTVPAASNEVPQYFKTKTETTWCVLQSTRSKKTCDI